MGLDTPVNKPPDGQITCGKSFIPVELARKSAENPIRGAISRSPAAIALRSGWRGS
jgi:hypothetical protein